jgi:hypothetical protein
LAGVRKSPVVWLLNEVHYYSVWVCTEASTVLRAVAEDFFFNCSCLEIPSDNRIRHVPRCVQIGLSIVLCMRSSLLVESFDLGRCVATVSCWFSALNNYAK